MKCPHCGTIFYEDRGLLKILRRPETRERMRVLANGTRTAAELAKELGIGHIRVRALIRKMQASGENVSFLSGWDRRAQTQS